MAALKNKIDFVALISVTNANGNGDPLNGNRPRTDYNGMGEISDVCIKRKLRNRMQDMGNAIFVQSEDRCDDGFKSLSDRATAATKGIKEKETYAQTACEKWMDVRSFGQVFAFKSNDKSGVSVGVRGPVSIHQAVSISPVEIEEMPDHQERPRRNGREALRRIPWVRSILSDLDSMRSRARSTCSWRKRPASRRRMQLL